MVGLLFAHHKYAVVALDGTAFNATMLHQSRSADMLSIIYGGLHITECDSQWRCGHQPLSPADLTSPASAHIYLASPIRIPPFFFFPQQPPPTTTPRSRAQPRCLCSLEQPWRRLRRRSLTRAASRSRRRTSSARKRSRVSTARSGSLSKWGTFSRTATKSSGRWPMVVVPPSGLFVMRSEYTPILVDTTLCVARQLY